MLVVCPQHVTAGAQEQLEAKDRLIQKLAANNKEKDNLIAVCAPPFFFVIYPVKITRTFVKSKKLIINCVVTSAHVRVGLIPL